MKESQLFIPKKIKVGYQKRDDTYTKMLAYVIYFDDAGVLRKEKSWEGWRNKQLTTNEYDNVPTEGFVLNKGVGGQRQSYGWNARNEYIRVYDPRGFEFEVSVANLLYILQECTSTKGKGLEGKFVYSWDGKELVLVPVDSEAYRVSNEYTKLQSKKVTTKELVPGCVYRTKKQLDLIYLGRFPWYTMVEGPRKEIVDRWGRDTYYDDYHRVMKESKMHIFLNEKSQEDYDKYVVVASPSNISVCIGDIPVSNYAELIEMYNKENICASKPIGLELKPETVKLKDSDATWNSLEERDYAFALSENEYALEQMSVDYNWNGGKSQVNGIKRYPRGVVVTFKDGKLKTNGNGKRVNGYAVTPQNVEDINRNGASVLYVKLENGEKIKFSKYRI